MGVESKGIRLNASRVNSAGNGRLTVPGYDPDAGIAGGTGVLFILITADNGPGLEGPLGWTSGLVERTADARCNP